MVYQMELTHLLQQNKKRLMKAGQERVGGLPTLTSTPSTSSLALKTHITSSIPAPGLSVEDILVEALLGPL